MDHLFIGTRGHVAAFEKPTGRGIRRTSLPGTGDRVVSPLLEDGLLFAGSRGRLPGLDPANGNILGKNGLGGLGHDHVFLTSERAAVGAGMAALASAARDDMRGHPAHHPHC